MKQDVIEPTFSKLSIPTTEGVVFIDYNDIVYLEADNNYTQIVGVEGFIIKSSYGLKKFQEKLPATQFVRCHSSSLINIHYIFKINKKERTCLLKSDKEYKVPVSRSGMLELDKLYKK